MTNRRRALGEVGTGHRMIPGPRGNVLLGVMREIQHDRLKFVMDMALQYGDMVKYRVAYVPICQINHPDGIRHVLQDNNKNYTKGFETVPTLEVTLGHGLLTNEGEPWLKQRRLMQPVFHHRNVESFGAVMTLEAEDLMRAWEAEAMRGEPIDVTAEMMKLTLAIVNRALFSSDVSDKADDVSRTLTILLEDAIMRFDLPFYPSPKVPTPHNRRFLRALNEMNAIIYGLINGRRQSPTAGSDLLNLLLNARDPETGEAMSDRQLRDEVITLFIAGHETTSVTLSWTWHLISQHPQVEAKLHRELAEVLGGRTPTPADLPNLAYTHMILDETLRLYPPAWILNRRAVKDDEICGYPIPAGTFLAISPYVMHHHPDYWEQPEWFNPDRFLPGPEISNRPRYAYFPFGGGPRQCIGKGFALVEAQLLMATIAQRFRLETVPGERVVPHPLVTLRPKGGLKLKVKRR